MKSLAPYRSLILALSLIFTAFGAGFLAPAAFGQISCLRENSYCSYTVRGYMCKWEYCSASGYCSSGPCCYKEWGYGTGDGTPGMTCYRNERYESQICGGLCGQGDLE